MEGIDLFVKILVFVKILSQSRIKEEEFKSLEVQEASSLRFFLGDKSVSLLGLWEEDKAAKNRFQHS
jgi:hypothetical protein